MSTTASTAIPEPQVPTNGRLLSLEKVNLAFGNKIILRDLDLEVRKNDGHGQIVCLLGPSGFGKTQLFRLIAGMPDRAAKVSGTIRIHHNGTEIPVHRGLVGVVAQDYPLFEHHRVISNLVIAGQQAGLSRKESHSQAMILLERFGLADRYDVFPEQLSGGQRQRVAIAQQLLCSQHYLLMDEPFSGLDVLAKARVCELIAELAALDGGNTIVIITHDIESAAAIGDHLFLIGRDHDATGNPIPGSRIVETIDMVAKGLAWHPELTSSAAFHDVVDGIKAKFRQL